MMTDSSSLPAPRIEPHVWRIAIVVILGAIMSVLDTTIVNVALDDLSTDLHSSLDSIQWVVTGYLLALAAIIPVTGWAARRFGSRRLYLGSLVLFTLGSALCGLAWSTGSLIAFRVLQGVGGGMLMPIGQMVLVKAAGPRNLPRVMSAIGVPIVLAPVFGPVLGGLLLEHAGWQWIFLVNLPFGLAAVPLALWLLPRDRVTPAPRPDFLGLLLVSGGSAAVTYGLAEAGSAVIRLALAIAIGAAMLAMFVVRSARIPRPLLDVRLYRSPAYAASSLMNFALGAVVFGGMILMPLYYQQVRHLDPVATGLLVAPTGIGVAITSRLAARLTDRFGSGRTALLGALVSAAGTIPFVAIGPATSYAWLIAASLVRGAGIGLCMIPAMAAIYRAIPAAKVSDGTTQVNVLNRLGGSAGTAVFTVALPPALPGLAPPAPRPPPIGGPLPLAPAAGGPAP